MDEQAIGAAIAGPSAVGTLVNVFTFDNTYFFDRQPHDECWYAYTHPAVDEPFAHGWFWVSNCEFARDPEDGRGFDDIQRIEIERILATHRESMNLDQFEPHLIRPDHYIPINLRSNRFSNFIDKLKWMGWSDPTVSVAFEKLTSRNPAYRLTRDFVRKLFDEAEIVTSEEVSEWLDECTKDTWVYDHEPGPNETYEDFYKMTERRLHIPDEIKKPTSANLALFEVDGLPNLYLLEETTDNELTNKPFIDSQHYIDLGSVFTPVPLPGHGGMSYYIL